MQKTFKIVCSKESEYGGCQVMAMLMIGYVILGFFFLSKWGFPGVLTLMLSIIGGHVYYRQSRQSKAIIRTDAQGFYLDILEKSTYLAIGTTRYEWQNLQEYHQYQARVTFNLHLQFAQAEELVFKELSVRAPFFKYLQSHFPEKESGKGK